MSEAVHTPLPWRFEDQPSNHIRSDAGCVFAWDYTTPENAALIVTAVNERPALLARVAELEAALRLVVEHSSIMARLEPDAHDAIISALSKEPSQ